MGAAVRVERRDGVAFLTLDSPATANALTPALARELVDACDEIDSDPAVGAAIICSSTRVFCSGAHRDLLHEWLEDPLGERNYEAIASIYDSFARVARLEVPSIAAVRGAAVGGGMNLVLATDLRIVAADSRLDSGFLRLGFHPGGGHYALLGRALPREAVAAIGLFNEPITGSRAAELGFAWECLPDEAVEDRAFELAVRIARAPAVTRMAVASLRDELGPPPMTLESAMELERAAQLSSLRDAARQSWATPSRGEAEESGAQDG